MAVPAMDIDVESAAIEALSNALRLALTPPRQRIGAIFGFALVSGFVLGLGFLPWLRLMGVTR